MASVTQHSEYLAEHGVAQLMERFLATLLNERPECPATFAAEFFRFKAESSAVPEKKKDWAVHLVITNKEVPPAALTNLAEFHSESDGCLRRFVGTVEAAAEEARAAGQKLIVKPWKQCVYAVYSSAEKLRGLDAEELDALIKEIGDSETVEEHWLEYAVGAGRREVCGELLWVTGLDTSNHPAVEKDLPEQWASALPASSVAEGFGFTRLYTKLNAPPNKDRPTGSFSGVNLSSFDSLEKWKLFAKDDKYAEAFASTGDIPRCPGIFRMKRYH